MNQYVFYCMCNNLIITGKKGATLIYTQSIRPCFYSRPEWTNQTLTLDRGIHVYSCFPVVLLMFGTQDVAFGCNLALHAAKSRPLDLIGCLIGDILIPTRISMVPIGFLHSIDRVGNAQVLLRTLPMTVPNS